MGVSRKCVKTWVDRFAAHGEAGLHDRSSRPHSTPSRTDPRLEAQVVALRTAQRRGQDWLGAELGIPARTVSRILRRHGLPYLRHLDPITGQVTHSEISHPSPGYPGDGRVQLAVPQLAQ
jgi:transposase